MPKPSQTHLLSLAIKFRMGHQLMVPVEVFDDKEACDHWQERLTQDIERMATDAPQVLAFLGIEAVGTSVALVDKHEGRIKLATVIDAQPRINGG